MPILSYLAVAGSVLVGLLFLADATLPARGPLGISTEFRGLSAALHGETVGSARAPALAPEPDMKSEAVTLARHGAPEPAAAAVVNVEPVNAPVARAEPAPKKRKHVARSREWRNEYAHEQDFGRNGGFNDRAWRNDFRRDDWRNDSWRNDSWRNDPWRR